MFALSALKFLWINPTMSQILVIRKKKKRTGEKKARTKKSGKEVVVELQPQSEPDVVCHDDDTIRPESELKCSKSVEKNVDGDVVVNDKENDENEERE